MAIRLRFLALTPSTVPDLPFLCGQEILLPVMTANAEVWIREGRAALVPEPIERAVNAPRERRGRGMRGRTM